MEILNLTLFTARFFLIGNRWKKTRHMISLKKTDYWSGLITHVKLSDQKLTYIPFKPKPVGRDQERDALRADRPDRPKPRRQLDQ